MKGIATILCYIALAVALTMAGLGVTDWQYWLAMVAAAGIQITSED